MAPKHIVTDPALVRSHALLDALGRMHLDFVGGAPPEAAFETLLSSLLRISESPSGLIAITAGGDGPELFIARTVPAEAAADPSAVVVARQDALASETAVPMLMDLLSRHDGEILADGKGIPWTPDELPPGHPPLYSLLAMLVRRGDEVIGVLALTNRPGGYSEDMADLMRAAVNMCAGIIQGYREERRRREAESALRRARDAAEAASVTAKAASDSAKAASDSAKAASEAKSAFIADLSHEVRAPINSVLLLADALAESLYGPVEPAQTEILRDIVDAAQFVLGLVNDALDVARIEYGHLNLAPQRLDVTAVGLASVRMVTPMATTKDVAVSFDSGSGPVMLDVDPLRFQQILVNLLTNAIKSTTADGRVGLAIRPTVGGTAFEVSDDGIGIPAGDIDRLFQPYVRIGEGRDGAGLGLYLVRRLVEAHGGTVSVESVVGRGSRFTVRLPDRTTADTRW